MENPHAATFTQSYGRSVTPDRHEFWRMQLLDDLRAKLYAIECQPALDPEGERYAALRDLIRRFEEIECDELRQRRIRTA